MWKSARGRGRDLLQVAGNEEKRGERRSSGRGGNKVSGTGRETRSGRGIRDRSRVGDKLDKLGNGGRPRVRLLIKN